MNEHPVVGIYVPNNKPMPIYYDPDSREVYYVDKKGGAYLLTGIDLGTTDPFDWRGADLDTLGMSLPVGFCGIILGIPYNWMLGEDGMARKVLSSTRNTICPFAVVEYTDNVEYKPKKD